VASLLLPKEKLYGVSHNLRKLFMEIAALHHTFEQSGCSCIYRPWCSYISVFSDKKKSFSKSTHCVVYFKHCQPSITKELFFRNLRNATSLRGKKKILPSDHYLPVLFYTKGLVVKKNMLEFLIAIFFNYDEERKFVVCLIRIS
jgi:hypothetical protein